MTMRIAEAAFVLHARPWRESSLLVEVLTAEHGRIGVVARGLGSARRHLLRAALQPLQCIRMEAVQRGELATLRSAEAVDTAPRLTGMGALSGFYINELTMRMVPRHDPMPELYAAYARMRGMLIAESSVLAWHLRCYERDLLAALGLGFDWHLDGDGLPVDVQADYWMEPEHGARRCDGGAPRGHAQVPGRALLALASDHVPDRDAISRLRPMMRELVRHHLIGSDLQSWRIARQLSDWSRE